ncbi:MAG: TlpA disulfide reductase family protein, partial [Planctomycetaceae bacterium]
AQRRERNERIITLATEIIAQTHDDPQGRDEFQQAVHHLMEARLQLALQADPQGSDSHSRIDALYEDAAALHEQFPKSEAAAEAAFTLARFANTNALLHADEEPRWLEEFSRRARLFAANFPAEQERAAPLLDAAGHTCDLHGLTEDAIACYSLLARQYPSHPLAAQIPAMLRRLRLMGQPLQLAGPTRDGGYLSIDEARGRIAIVAFWATDTENAAADMDRLAELASLHTPAKLEIIGVSLDSEEAALQEFLNARQVPGRHILFPDPEQRRWNSPIARYYGVRDIPQYWLVDAHGRVAAMTGDVERLPAAIQSLRAGN